MHKLLSCWCWSPTICICFDALSPCRENKQFSTFMFLLKPLPVFQHLSTWRLSLALTTTIYVLGCCAWPRKTFGQQLHTEKIGNNHDPAPFQRLRARRPTQPPFTASTARLLRKALPHKTACRVTLVCCTCRHYLLRCSSTRRPLPLPFHPHLFNMAAITTLTFTREQIVSKNNNSGCR